MVLTSGSPGFDSQRGLQHFKRDKVKLPSDIDKECLELCVAMNKLPGIQTTSSCAGHGKTPYWVFFVADDLEVLPALLYYVKACHSGVTGWHVDVSTDCGMSPVTFCLEGPSNDHKGAKQIATAIEEYVKSLR